MCGSGSKDRSGCSWACRRWYSRKSGQVQVSDETGLQVGRAVFCDGWGNARGGQTGPRDPLGALYGALFLFRSCPPMAGFGPCWPTGSRCVGGLESRAVLATRENVAAPVGRWPGVAAYVRVVVGVIHSSRMIYAALTTRHQKAVASIPRAQMASPIQHREPGGCAACAALRNSSHRSPPAGPPRLHQAPSSRSKSLFR